MTTYLTAAGHFAWSRPRGHVQRKPIEELPTNDLQLWKLLKGRQVESGLGQEAVEQARLVLHPPEPGLDQRGQLIDVLLDQVGQGPFQVRPDRLDRVELGRVGRELEDGQPVP